MSQLVIEYVLEGHQRGYNFTSPTAHIEDAVLKEIWRKAMPRGQGWGGANYSGARSIKGFMLPDGRIAVSEVTVTDMQDENGRKGIRRALIDLMTPAVYAHHLRSRLAGYPALVISQARHDYEQIQRHPPKLKKEQPLLIGSPYDSAHNWWATEALVLMLAQNPPRRLNHWPQPITFTTLALDHRSENQIVALPTERAEGISEQAVVLLA